MADPMKNKNLYEILKIDRNASQQMIQDAYQRLKRDLNIPVYHLDWIADETFRVRDTHSPYRLAFPISFKLTHYTNFHPSSQLDQAYSILSDQEKRKAYDALHPDGNRDIIPFKVTLPDNPNRRLYPDVLVEAMTTGIGNGNYLRAEELIRRREEEQTGVCNHLRG
ncbi:hypothetical protein F4810DRAFT_156681 [Camillea tinctor]|nr:hypothetical protein F4810DRAFT_156681 [Camillea tinctor]